MRQGQRGANRMPPYALGGGVRDALRATRGYTYAVTNSEIARAQRLFEATERTPVGPESGAALAALQQALALGRIGRADPVLLHVTGNAESLACDAAVQRIPVWLRVPCAMDAALRGLDRAFGF